MSKASEWAGTGRRMHFRERLTKQDRRGGLTPFVAIVGAQGALVLDKDDHGEVFRLRPDEALRFARWIIDTFGDA